MKLFKLTTIALAGALTFAACKYEEGPRISLRTKRDRVSNEWRIIGYTKGGNDSLSRLRDPESGFELIFNFYRTGSYGIEVVKKVGDKYVTNHTRFGDSLTNGGLGFDACCHVEYSAYINNLPNHIQYIRPGGEWTFDKGHYKIQVKPELSYDNNEVLTQKNTIDWTIVMLREKEMKVKGRDDKDVEWTLHFERLNDEPYFY